MKYLLSLDSGTTSCRASLFTTSGKKIMSACRVLTCFYPKHDCVNQDPMEIYIAALDCINEVFVKMNITAKDVIGLGITNQRETTLLVDKNTMLPLTEAIVWQSNETSFLLKQYEPYKEVISQLSGLPLSPYFSSTKIRFLLDKYDLQEKAENGDVLFCTIDTWLIYKLTDGEVFATDVTNACRTQLVNINTGDYDKELLKIFNIPLRMLPEIRNSTDSFGITKKFSYGNIEICGVAGDQQSALLGHGINELGGIKVTYGTGLFCLLHTGNRLYRSNNGLLSTIALKHEGKLYYALEGSVFIGGAAVQWLRDNLNLIEKSSDTKICAEKSTDDEIYFVPSFNGLGTPYWDDKCKGAFLGLSRGTDKNDMCKAVLQGIAFQACDVLNAMKEDTGITDYKLFVDGGAASNDYMMQFQSDILNATLFRKEEIEITSLGAAVLVGLNKGIFKLNNLSFLNNKSKIFITNMKEELRQKKIDRYHRAVEAVRLFSSNEN